MTVETGASGNEPTSTDGYRSSRGHHVEPKSIGPYLIVALNSQRPFDRPLRVALGEATRININRGPERVVRRDVDSEGTRVCDVFIADSTMSGEHAFITLGDDPRDNKRYWLWDCGSKNGTANNGERVTGAVELADGDWVGVGCTFLLFRSDASVTGAFASRAELESGEPMASLNPLVAESLGRARLLAESPSPVLIQGPLGSGRRTLARAMHERSGRPGAFVETESRRFLEELFAFREARDGTLYVRDVEELNREAVTAVFRGLANEEILSGGSSTVRLIASCGEAASLPLELGQGFGERVISLPSLVHRREDLGRFVAELLERFGANPAITFRRSVSRALGAHPWNANIAELAEVIRQGVIYAQDGPVQLAHLPRSIRDTESAALERRRLVEVLVKHGGSVKEAASELGLSRQSVYKRAEKYGIKIDAFRTPRGKA